MTRITIKSLFAVGIIILFGGCATAYQDGKGTFTGGWYVKQMEGDIYRVVFSGNGYTSRETAQTYWLYRSAELALEKGYDGFKILSHITLTQSIDPEIFFSKPSSAKTVQYYVPIYIDESNKPVIEADIKLVNHPFENSPPKLFDAKMLKDAVEQYVLGEKCNMKNVCEHVHRYLYLDEEKEEI